MHVLQGVTGQAGQPHALAAGLREIGIHAETCAIATHKFGYPADQFVDLSDAHSLAEVYQRLMPLIARFDVFHFHARSFLSDWPDVRFPAALDLILLKLHGKKVFFHFRGQEIRLASQFSATNPFHYVNEPAGHVFRKIPDASKLILRDLITSICDGVFVTDPELQTYVPGSIVVPRALDAAAWDFVGVSDRETPIVVHAPSRRGVKGTRALVAAANELRAEGLKFELRLVENMGHTEAVECYRQADIIVDQLRIGWYGVLACEAMALGKPVITYVREDLWQHCKDDLPIINANPLTIKDRLKYMVESREIRTQRAAQSREYFLHRHSAARVAELLSGLYASEPKSVELAGVARFLDRQMARSGSTMADRGGSGRRLQQLWDVWRADGTRAAYDTVGRFFRRQLGKLG